MVDFAGTFDATNALSGMFLWVLFGFLTAMVNCDLQRALRHPLVFHLVGLTAFFFLFTVLDTNNKSHIAVVFAKTLFVYALFVLMTKSKWYFVLPALGLLLMDQALKKQAAFRAAAGEKPDEERVARASAAVNAAVVALAVVGALHYAYLQRIQYGRKFNLAAFFSVRRCSRAAPNYGALRFRG